MEQLSGLDAAFLYLETPTTPMHIGGVYIFDGSTRGEPFDFEAYRNLIASRLHLVRAFRQRLVNVPLNLARPYWIEDPDFNLDFHLHHTALPKPGGWKELARLMARIFSRPLNRTRPLWETTFAEGLDTIEGVPPGSFAMISKVHHAAIDGVSGAEMMGALLDLTPELREIPEPKPWKPERIPGDLELLVRTYGKDITQPFKLAELLAQTLWSAVKVGVQWGIQDVKLPPVPFQAPRTRLDVPVTPHRVWGGVRLSLDRIKAIKNTLEGTTVNDVVLAICAGALRRYLQQKHDLPDEPLVAMAPISVRAEEKRGAMGNQVSAMLVSLATQEADPIKRLQLTHESAVQSKVYNQAIGAHMLIDYTQFIPFSVAGLAARLYTRMHVAKLHHPIFNVVITNVPGPQVPLYMGGARLLAYFGTAPIFDGMGLILVALSYAGNLTISATSCREIMPDIDVFVHHLKESLDELHAAVVKRGRRRAARKTASTKRKKAMAAKSRTAS
jgi:WS/DGAT/MGAT family acyltransferase